MKSFLSLRVVFACSLQIRIEKRSLKSSRYIFLQGSSKKTLELTKNPIVISCILNAWKTQQSPNGF